MITKTYYSLTSSLEIVEPEPQINISHDSQDSEQFQYLDYSRDESSLSFQIYGDVSRRERSNSKYKYKSKDKLLDKSYDRNGYLNFNYSRHGIYDNILKYAKDSDAVLSNYPPKRKRKYIFDKYKVIALDSGKEYTPVAEAYNDILRTFDEIFSLNTPRSQKSQYNSLDSPIKNFMKKSKSHYYTDQSKTNEKKFQITKTPEKGISMLKKYPVKFVYNAENVNANHDNYQKPKASTELLNGLEAKEISKYPSVNFVFNKNTKDANLLKSYEFFKTPFDVLKEKYTYMEKKYTNSNILQEKTNKNTSLGNGNKYFMNLSAVEYRISYIEGKYYIYYSKDSADFAYILGAEIFNLKPYNNNQNIEKNSENEIAESEYIEIQKLIESPYRRVKIEPLQLKSPRSLSNMNSPSQYHNNFQKPHSENKIPESSMAYSRFSDMYQRIDMSHSIASSAVFKDANNKQTPMNIYGLGNQEVLGGYETYGAFDKIKKSSSQGFIAFGNVLYNLPSPNKDEDRQDYTIINNLKTERTPEISEYSRLPPFLRRTSSLNSFYPNLSNPNFNSTNENMYLSELVCSFLESISFLENTLENIKIKDWKIKEIYSSLKGGVSIVNFLAMDFEQFYHFPELNLLKSKDGCMGKYWNSAKVTKALQNYRKIVSNHENIEINFMDYRGVSRYFDIRRRYWYIEKNMILIANDMYVRIICQRFPYYVLEMKKVLEEKYVLFTFDQIREKKLLIENIKFLRSKGDPFCLSDVGLAVLDKLRHQIMFNSSNY